MLNLIILLKLFLIEIINNIKIEEINMKIKLITIFLSISFLTAGQFGGYSIFGYDNQSEGFDVNRVYVQYTDNLADDLFMKIRYDLDRPTDGKLYGYLKNAYVDWTCKTGGLFTIGLLGTNSYGVQEQTWGYRYVAKSAPDYWKLTNTADFGVGYSHSFGDINFNAQILNGEGYKEYGNKKNTELATYIRVFYGESKLNKNDGYNVGLVMTSTPGGELDKDKTLMGVFGGWSKDNLRFGVEHNSHEYGETITINSVYMNYSMGNWNFFARNDMMEEDSDHDHKGHDHASEHSITHIGASWNPTNGLYISPNVIMDDAKDEDTVRLTFMFKY